MNKVGIILINYKDYAQKYLLECITSLRKINFPTEQKQIFIVDNESTPETRQTIAKIAPEAILIVNQDNIGFGAGNNSGIKKAQEYNCNYFFLLNMDTKVDPNFLKYAFEAYQTDKQIGLLQSRLMLYEKPELINSLGNAMHYLGFGYCTAYEKPFTKAPEIMEIPYASGAALMLSQEVFEKIGEFNPEFFMYHDDMEWGIKARLQGYKNVIATKSVVFHKYEFSRSIDKYYWMERNRILLWLMTLKLWTLVLILPMFIITELGLLLLAIKGGWFYKKVDAYSWFFHAKNWEKVCRWRKQIQGRRQISDRELSQSLTAELTDYKFSVSGLLTFFANIIFSVYWAVIKLLII